MKITIVNDEDGDTGTVNVEVKDSSGKVVETNQIAEGAENEFEFPEGGTIVISPLDEEADDEADEL